jgi:hypothetical protein
LDAIAAIQPKWTRKKSIINKRWLSKKFDGLAEFLGARSAGGHA